MFKRCFYRPLLLFISFNFHTTFFLSLSLKFNHIAKISFYH